MKEQELLLQLVNTSESLSEILRKQGKAISGAALKVLKNTLEAYNIDYGNLDFTHTQRKVFSLNEKLQKGTNVKSQALKTSLSKQG